MVHPLLHRLPQSLLGNHPRLQPGSLLFPFQLDWVSENRRLPGRLRHLLPGVTRLRAHGRHPHPTRLGLLRRQNRRQCRPRLPRRRRITLRVPLRGLLLLPASKARINHRFYMLSTRLSWDWDLLLLQHMFEAFGTLAEIPITRVSFLLGTSCFFYFFHMLHNNFWFPPYPLFSLGLLLFISLLSAFSFITRLRHLSSLTLLWISKYSLNLQIFNC